ncbi:MAG: hypothetical protein M0015_09750 [Betaproteobacteria bacterium]|nr:hypothetical protein [Betaproteobacteria bacterium]
MYLGEHILASDIGGRAAAPARRTLVYGAPGAGVSSLVRQLLAAQQRARVCPTDGPLRIVEASGDEDAIELVGAAHGAQAALVVLNALQPRAGVTRRSAYAARLLGARRVIVAVNKMDLVGYAPQVFDRLELEVLRHAGTPAAGWCFVPVSAGEGEMVASRGARMPWYRGPTLAEALGTPQALAA